ncbi:MAG: rhomboid family intramembrane serine protease [Alphaproteobacteria bacterium]|nr:rhomboid family intramembrane serine protease [Alphaproteobacteria bacterium]
MSQPSQPMINATPAVLALIGANVAIHLVRLLLPEQWSMIIGTLGGFSPPWFLGAVMGEQEDYVVFLLASPLTYAFLHADLLHLVINMAFLLAFGTPLDRRLGRGRFLTLYVLCALVAAGASVALFYYTFQQTIIVGASGAVSGLFGAILRVTTKRAWIAGAVFIGSNLVIGYTGLPVAGEVRAIAWEAHIGGFVAGYLLMLLLDRGAVGSGGRWS